MPQNQRIIELYQQWLTLLQDLEGRMQQVSAEDLNTFQKQLHGIFEEVSGLEGDPQRSAMPPEMAQQRRQLLEQLQHKQEHVNSRLQGMLAVTGDELLKTQQGRQAMDGYGHAGKGGAKGSSNYRGQG